VLLAAAGTIYWINGWVYFGFILSYLVVYTLLLLRINPGLLNERGKFLKEDTKSYDKVYAVLYIPLTYLTLIVSGFDAVRFEWSSMPVWVTLLGLALVIAASVSPSGPWQLIHTSNARRHGF
jgi:protein-S-isoprenylcysteine O-methyltransferase Ste14